MPSEIIQTTDALMPLCAALRTAPWIALDTEFTRTKTYYARLGLIQVAAPDLIACVDPLALSVDPLLAVLRESRAPKILHAARQDLEVLYDPNAGLPRPVFDTQIAAALVGNAEQVGYASLVEAYISIKLPKLHTRTDWEARPLSAEQLTYAEDDVRFLGALYEQLHAELVRTDRLAWMQEECAGLTDRQLYTNDPRQAYARFKGGHLLPPAAQPRLQRLIEWRERVAQDRDLPRAWVVPDAALIEIARIAPTDLGQLGSVRQVTPPLVRVHGEAILDVLAQAAELPPERLWSEAGVPTPEEKEVVRAMQERIQATAERARIAPGVITGRRALLEFVRSRQGPLARGWRYELIGRELERAFGGEP